MVWIPFITRHGFRPERSKKREKKGERERERGREREIVKQEKFPENFLFSLDIPINSK